MCNTFCKKHYQSGEQVTSCVQIPALFSKTMPILLTYQKKKRKKRIRSKRNSRLVPEDGRRRSVISKAGKEPNICGHSSICELQLKSNGQGRFSTKAGHVCSVAVKREHSHFIASRKIRSLFQNNVICRTALGNHKRKSNIEIQHELLLQHGAELVFPLVPNCERCNW